MTRAYTPSPGSVAQRAIAHLETLPARTELSTAALAEAIGVQPNNLRACLEAPAKAGLIFGRQKYAAPRAPFFWSLAPVARETNDFDPAPVAEASGSQTPEGADSEGRAEAGSVQCEGGVESGHALMAGDQRPTPTGLKRRGDAHVPDSEHGGRVLPVLHRAGVAPGPSHPTTSAPLVGTNASMSLSGEIAIVAECGTVILFDKQRAQQLLQFLAGRVA